MFLVFHFLLLLSFASMFNFLKKTLNKFQPLVRKLGATRNVPRDFDIVVASVISSLDPKKSGQRWAERARKRGPEKSCMS